MYRVGGLLHKRTSMNDISLVLYMSDLVRVIVREWNLISIIQFVYMIPVVSLCQHYTVGVIWSVLVSALHNKAILSPQRRRHIVSIKL